MRRLVLAAVVLVALGAAETAVAAPPAYPPGAPRNASRCIRFTVNGANHGPNHIPPGSAGLVTGGAGCADPLEIGVQLRLEDGNGNNQIPPNIFNAAADGSYTSQPFTYPATAGDYTFVVVTNSSTVVRDINVGATGGGGGGGGPPASSRRGAGFLSLWLLLLFGIVTMLVLGVRRKMPWLQPMRARRSRDDARALPAPDVPFLDTSHFAPQGMHARPERSERADAFTEADI